MAATYTTNVGLTKPGLTDYGWGTTLNSVLDTIDAFQSVGGGGVKTTETPSTTLNVRVGAATFAKSDGTLVTTTATTSLTLTASATNYIYLSNAGTVTVSTSSFPAIGTAHVRLATVVAGSSTITSVTDSRLVLRVNHFQRSGADQTALTDSTGGSTAAYTIADVGASFSQSTLNNNFARVVKLVNELRAALVDSGIIKGSA